MNKLDIFAQKIDSLSEWSGRIFSFLVIPLTCLIVFEVISRAMNVPTIWTFELSIFLFGAHFMLLAAYGLKNSSHVSIDLIVERLPKKARLILSLATHLILFFPFVLTILFYGTHYAADSWGIWEKSWSIWAPPLYPIKTVIPVTALLLLLQGLSQFIKIVRELEGVKNEP